jgi:hypothetical protein
MPSVGVDGALPASQRALFEPLQADETGVEIEVVAPAASIVETATRWMESHGE